MLKRAISVLGFLLGVGTAEFLNIGTTEAIPQESPVQFLPAYVSSGRQMFQDYCAACHGADGKGRGPIVPFFRALPPDLTTLAKRHDGTFPEAYVSTVLLFGRGSRAHGPIDMPVWGPSSVSWTTTTKRPCGNGSRISASILNRSMRNNAADGKRETRETAD